MEFLQPQDIQVNDDTDINQEQDSCMEDYGEADQEIETTSTNNYQLVRDRSNRVSKPTQRHGFSAYIDLLAYAFMSAVELDRKEPTSYTESMKCQDSKLWMAAIKKEMNFLYKNETWVMLERPKDQSTISCKWIYKLKKRATESEPVKYKARLVSK